MGTIECVFIGNDFYYESGSRMSDIYKIVPGGLERYDYGRLEIDASENNINIRPANSKEMDYFESKLKDSKKHRKARP